MSWTFVPLLSAKIQCSVCIHILTRRRRRSSCIVCLTHYKHLYIARRRRLYFLHAYVDVCFARAMPYYMRMWYLHLCTYPQIVYSLAHSMKGWWWYGAYGCYSLSGYHHNLSTTPTHLATSSEDYKERVWEGGGRKRVRNASRENLISSLTVQRNSPAAI